MRKLLTANSAWPSSSIRLVALYSASAALSTIINIGVQALVVLAYKGTNAIPVSIVLGTLAGLPLKYIIEKRYVFNFESKNLREDSWLFIIYSCLGLVTTVLFWAVEYGFQVAFGTDNMRYLGATVGLVLGNLVKYQLDKRLVFNDNPRIRL